MSEEKKEKLICSKEELRLLYTQLLEGITKVKSEDVEGYIKHNSAFDSNKVDVVRFESLAKAKSEGLPTEEEKTEYLIKEELWSKEDDTSVAQLQGYYKNLKLSLSKMFLKSQQDVLKQKVKDTEEELLRLLQKKRELLGLTAEGYSEKKANEYHLSTGLFKDDKCKEFFFSEEDFDHLDERKLSGLLDIYNDVYRKFSAENLKRMALMPYFLNSFYLCDDNPFVFFGKAIVDLTFNQVSLFGQGKYFKHLLQNSKNPPPDEFMEDPDELINWFEQSKSAEEAMSKLEAKAGKSAESQRAASGAQGTSLVGATKDDLKRLGIGQSEHDSISLDAEAAQKGGKLSMADLIKLHGVGKD